MTPSEAWRQDEDDYLRASRQELVAAYRREMGPFIGSLASWTLFATLTFDPLVMVGTSPAALKDGREKLALPAVSRWTAMRRFGYFLKHTSRAVGRRTDGVIALEMHQSGQPHGHGLLGLEDGLATGDVALLAELWHKYTGNGWLRLEVPRSQEDVTGYCAKYMAKDVSELVFSSSLNRPARP